MIQAAWFHIGRTLVTGYVRHILKASVHFDSPLPHGAKILAANHPSTNDPAFVTALLREQSTILIKETLFKVPVFGRSLRLAGHVPVIAGSGKLALEQAERLLRAGRTIIIFPEGVISPACGPGKAHTGVARLALATGAPVIPVGISLDQAMLRVVPTRVEDCDEPSAWYLHGPYAMTVGQPHCYEGSLEDREQVRAISEQIMGQIVHLHQRGMLRLRAAQEHAAWKAARASRVSKAARWATIGVAQRAMQAALFFLIGTAGRV